MKRFRNSLLAITPTLLSTSGCASVYRAKPIDATIVDSQTNQPISGVVVVAHWQLKGGGFPETHSTGQLAVQEAVSDAAGRFRLPGFSPRVTVLEELVSGFDPELLIFKSGYKPLFVPGMGGRDPLPSSRNSTSGGMILKLEQVGGNSEVYLAALSKFNWLFVKSSG